MAPLKIRPLLSSSSLVSCSVIMTKIAAARCAPTRIKSLTLVGLPTRQMMLRPSLVRQGRMPRSARVCASLMCISSFVMLLSMMTMSLTARLVDGRSNNPHHLNAGMRLGK